MAAWRTYSSQEATSEEGDPQINSIGIPHTTSPLIGGGNNIGYVRDARGVTDKEYIGPYAAPVTRGTATTRQPRI